MQNYFAEKIEPGAPSRPDTHRRVKTYSKNDAKRRNFKIHYFGLPNDKTDPLYTTILNIDAVARKQVLPVTAPLQINFTATGKKRDTLIENLENWDILRNSKVICGADDASFSLACDNIGTYAAAIKIGNEFISKSDAIYKFKGCPIILAKTIITKTSRFVMESQLVEPIELCEYKMKILKPLDLGPFLDAVSNFNSELGEIGTHNVYRKLRKLDLLQEPRRPTNDHKSLNIHDNYHGGDDVTLTRWLSSLIKYDVFLAQFESLKNDLERRKKNDKERMPPLGVTFALGKSNLEKIDATIKKTAEESRSDKADDENETLDSNMGTINCGPSHLAEPNIPGDNPQKNQDGPKNADKITNSQLGRAIDRANQEPNPPSPNLNTRPQSTPAKTPLPSQGRVIAKAIKSLTDTLSQSGKKRKKSTDREHQSKKVPKIETETKEESDDDVDFSLEDDPEKSRISAKKDDTKNSSGTSHYEEVRDKLDEKTDLESLGIVEIPADDAENSDKKAEQEKTAETQEPMEIVEGEKETDKAGTEVHDPNTENLENF